jgi:hypothetical protein
VRDFTARFVVFACTLITLAANVATAEGYLWLGYGVIASSILGAIIATSYVPHERFLYGVLFATLTYGAISEYTPLSGGLTARHGVAFVVATLVLGAFVVLSSAGRNKLLLRERFHRP